MTIIKMLWAAAVAALVTSIIQQNRSDNKFDRLLALHREEKLNEYMEGVKTGRQDAKDQYNEHPHLYCPSCFPPPTDN